MRDTCHVMYQRDGQRRAALHGAGHAARVLPAPQPQALCQRRRPPTRQDQRRYYIMHIPGE